MLIGLYLWRRIGVDSKHRSQQVNRFYCKKGDEKKQVVQSLFVKKFVWLFLEFMIPIFRRTDITKKNTRYLHNIIGAKKNQISCQM